MPDVILIESRVIWNKMADMMIYSLVINFEMT